MCATLGQLTDCVQATFLLMKKRKLEMENYLPQIIARSLIGPSI